VLEQAQRGGRGCGREEDPRREPAEQEEPVVVAPDLRDSPQHGEDEEVHEHEHERVEERPPEAEHGAAVLRSEIAPEEASEQVSEANYIGVNGHAGQSRPTPGSTTLSRSCLRSSRLRHSALPPQSSGFCSGPASAGAWWPSRRTSAGMPAPLRRSAASESTRGSSPGSCLRSRQVRSSGAASWAASV